MAKYPISQSNLLVIAGILILTLNGLTAAQADQTSYAVPKAVKLERIARTIFPSYFHPKRDPEFGAEGFFPIGWSRDGKFAYYTEPIDEACGCYFANLIIQDMRTDKVLWNFDYDQDKERDPATDKMPPEDNIAKLWAKNRKLFSDKLHEYGIESSPFTLLGKTFSSGGRSYTATVAAPKGDDPDGIPHRKSVTLSMTSSKLGSKVLYKAEYKGDEMYGSPIDVGVAGAYKSPFENRVAVVMIEIERGFEGDHNANVRIVGADLAGGF